MLQMERSGKPRPVADRYRHGPGVRKSSIGKEVDLHREYHHAIFLAIASVLESSKIKASSRSDSPEFATIGTENGTSQLAGDRNVWMHLGYEGRLFDRRS
ncbi:TPA: hypothetical protein L5R00_005842 [Pseudomonas aeruginosa]|nr:hypothetical protein [Pseudomonas aeruginosa]